MNEQPADGQDIPVPIDDSETIVRAVVANAHYDVKKGKVRPSAFRPKAGETAISTMRQLMGDGFCKAKAVEIAENSPGQTYIGLLAITAAQIRAEGSEIADSRSEWLGHADLDHGFPSPPPNEPASAAEFQRMTERCQALLRAAVFQKDPIPESESWDGDQLVLATKRSHL